MQQPILYKTSIALLVMWLPLLVSAKTPGTDITKFKENPALQKRAQQLQGAQSGLGFIENKGQITDQYGKQRRDIDYKLETPAMNIFIGNGQLHYQWTTPYPPEGETQLNIDPNSQNILQHKSPESSQNTSPWEGIRPTNERSNNGRWFNNRASNITSPLEGIRPTNERSNNGRGVDSRIETYRMDVTLIGADLNAAIITEDKQDYFENYYLPQCPDGATAYSYKKITYKNIYPGIDWVLYVVKSKVKSENPKLTGDVASPLGQQDSREQSWPGDGSGETLKYDFVVHEGGDVNDIKLKYEGATELIMNNGALIAATPCGSIREEAPYSYDAATGKPLASSYVLEDNTLSFKTAQYNGNVVIDPVLEWATYYGDAGNDNGYAVITDIAGNPYMAGRTASSLNIATTGAYQTSLNGGSIGDAFLVKFNIAGDRKWCTYYGGSADDLFSSLASDRQGNIFAAGLSYSSGLATAGSFQTSPAPALLVKFDSTGARQWATYYNGRWGVSGSLHYVACDIAGNVYMAGSTDSINNVATGSSSHQGSLGGGQDGYLAKFNSLGQRQWATYYGGSSDEDIFGVSADPAGNIFIAGQTKSTNNIASGGYQNNLGGNPGTAFNAFVAKFNGNGSRQWATYYGVGAENALAITCDLNGNVIIGGNQSHPGLGTTGAYQANYAGNGCFVAKFSGTGVRQMCTYAPNNMVSVTTDVVGNIYVGGYREVNNQGISTANGYHPNIAGGYDVFLIEFSSDGSQKPWGSFYGGTDNEVRDANGNFPPYFGVGAGLPNFNNSITCSNKNRVYMANTTASSNGIAYNAYQPNYGGGTSDAFIVSFISDTIPFIPQPYTDTLFCAGDSIRLGYGVNANFKSGNIFTLQLSDAGGSFTSPLNIGSKTTTGMDTIRGRIPTNTVSGTGYRLRIVATNPVRTSSTDSADIHIKGIPQAFVASGNSPVCVGDSIKLTSSSSSSGVGYSWSGPLAFGSQLANPKIANAIAAITGDYVDTATLGSGCKIVDTVTIQVDTLPPPPHAGSNSPLCPGATLDLSAATISNVSYNWTGPGSYGSPQQNTSRNNMSSTEAGRYYLTVTFTTTGCKAKDSTDVFVHPVTPTPVAGGNSPVCRAGSLTLIASSIPGATYHWTGPAGFSAGIQNPSRSNMQLSYAGNYTVVATSAVGCLSAPAATTVNVIMGPSVSIYPSPNDSICTNGGVALVSIPFNVGPVATYDWYKNGVSTGVTTNSLIPTSVNSGDVFYVLLTAATACNTPVTSNQVTVTVLPNTPPPTASITANPATNIWPGLFVAFSSSITNGGTSPSYQWKRNGKNVVGATNATWGATDLNNNDTICLSVTSSDICATPKSVLSNCIEMSITTGVPLNPLGGDFSVYPNPNRGEFTLSAPFGSQPLNPLPGDLYVYTLQGQVVAHYAISAAKTVIQLPKGLSAGVYMGMYVNGEGKASVMRIVVE